MPQQKPIKPEYQAWRRRVEGQIRHTINEHPEWFNLPNEKIYDRCVRSMAKRIIGEIVAGTNPGDKSKGNAITSVFLWTRLLCNFWSAVTRAVGGTPTADRPSSTNNGESK
jgi:hypothetical protein